MRYLLAVLTCGRPEYLTRTLASYMAFLDPAPSAVYVWDDGMSTPPSAYSPLGGLQPTIEGYPHRIGRCSGHAQLWGATRTEFADFDWVFTIEDDLVLLRPLNVGRMAGLLELEPTLAQVALVRCPWGAEIEVGGYIPLFPDRYERRKTEPGFEWIASTVDWTSSPALLPTTLTKAVDWPIGHGCELELGPRILQQHPDAVSGYWGWGEPWCSHIGLERAPGSHGY